MARILNATDFFKATFSVGSFPRFIYAWVRQTTNPSTNSAVTLCGLFRGTGSGPEEVDYVDVQRNTADMVGKASDNNNWDIATGSSVADPDTTWRPVLYMMDSASNRTIQINTSTSNGTLTRTPTNLNRVGLGIYVDTDDVNYNADETVWEVADFGIVPATPTSGEITDFVTNNISGKVVWPAGSYGGRSAEREHWDLFEAGDLNANEVGTINSTALAPTGGPANATHPTLDYGGGGGGSVRILVPNHYKNGRKQVLTSGIRN